MSHEIVVEDGKKYIKEKMWQLSDYEIHILETNFIRGLSKVVKKKVEGEFNYSYFPYNHKCQNIRLFGNRVEPRQ